MRSSSGLSLAVDDSRARNEALIGLIAMADQQAITLLGIYLSLGTATATGAAAGLIAGATYSIVSAPLITTTATLFLGSVFCFLTMRRSTVSLPGREPAFWLWAIKYESISEREAVVAYLSALAKELEVNRKVNVTSARYLATARACGLGTPVAAAVAGVLVHLFKVPLAF